MVGEPQNTLRMKNLEQTRREIDRIDEGLVKLFLERLAVLLKKKASPIVMILLSAGLGMLLYGVF